MKTTITSNLARHTSPLRKMTQAVRKQGGVLRQRGKRQLHRMLVLRLKDKASSGVKQRRYPWINIRLESSNFFITRNFRHGCLHFMNKLTVHVKWCRLSYYNLRSRHKKVKISHHTSMCYDSPHFRCKENVLSDYLHIIFIAICRLCFLDLPIGILLSLVAVYRIVCF